MELEERCMDQVKAGIGKLITACESNDEQHSLGAPDLLPFTRCSSMWTTTSRTCATCLHPQMLDERRLSLLVNSKGMVLEASHSPTSLFNLDPQALIGCPVAHILDILKPPTDLAVSIDVPGLLDHEEQAAKTLLLMAKK